MTGNRIIRPILAALVVVAMLGAFSMTTGGTNAPLADRLDPVIVEGKAFPAFILGAPISNYRLFARRGADMAPIPFQVDERDEKGTFIPQKGPKAKSDSDNGAFDANDELVFMARDAAEKIAEKPTISGCSSFAEISAPDPSSGATGYVYLARCANPPDPSPKRYVKWDPAKRTAVTDCYKFGYQTKPVYYYDHISIFDGPDILDRLKLRVRFGIGRLRFTINEDHFKPDIGGYTVGPVRIIYFNQCKLKMGPLGSFPLGGQNFFYREWAYLHVVIDVRFNPAVLGIDYRVGTINDLMLDRSRGYKLCAESIPDCRPITGETTPEMLELAKKDIRWGGIVGPEGAFITWLVMDPKLRTRSIAFYLDDDNAKRKPEYVPGSSPETGLLIVDWKGSKRGTYFLQYYHCFMKEFSKTEMKRFEQMIYKPLKAKVIAI